MKEGVRRRITAETAWLVALNASWELLLHSCPKELAHAGKGIKPFLSPIPLESAMKIVRCVRCVRCVRYVCVCVLCLAEELVSCRET